MLNHRSSSSARSSRSRRSSQSGYTILEVAIASFVMVMGLTSSIIAMQVGFRQVELARSTTIASQILQSEMERIRMMSWSMINNTSIMPASASFDGATNFSSNPKLVGKFMVTRTAAADSTRPTEVKRITVAVTWTSYDGATHTRSLSSLYAKNGLYDYYYTIAHP